MLITSSLKLRVFEIPIESSHQTAQYSPLAGPGAEVAVVRGADAGLDVVLLLHWLQPTVGPGDHRPVQTAQQDAGGETLSDDGPVVWSLLPGVVQAGLALTTGLPLTGVLGLELRTVRGRGRVEAAAGEALDSASNRDTRRPRRSCCRRSCCPPRGRSPRCSSCCGGGGGQCGGGGDPPPGGPPGAGGRVADPPLPVAPLAGAPPGSPHPHLPPSATRLAAGAPSAPLSPGARKGESFWPQLLGLEEIPLSLVPVLDLRVGLLALDGEGGVGVGPDSGPRGELPGPGEAVDTVPGLTVPDPGPELPQLGSHHPEAHPVLLADEEVGEQLLPLPLPLLHIHRPVVVGLGVSPVDSDVERLVQRCLSCGGDPDSGTAGI